jgi:hypothetical protein
MIKILTLIRNALSLRLPPRLSSDTLGSLYSGYASIKPNDYSALIDPMQEDKVLRYHASESCLDCVFSSEDFYRHIPGIGVFLRDDRFEIVDRSNCGFPDYLKAVRYDLTDQNVRKAFPNNFTPQMFQNGVLRFIRRLDDVFVHSVDPKKFDREGKFDGFKWLYNQAKKRS